MAKPYIQFNMRMTVEQFNQLEQAAKRLNLSMAEVVRVALEQLFVNNDKKVTVRT
jgi:hypothetical protein